jgi:hypothetical protein
MRDSVKKMIYSWLSPGQSGQNALLTEIHWAHIFHDTIRDKEWLTKLSLSPYGMSANYSMLYVMTRILTEFNISSVLELGLGESSKIINACAESLTHLTNHDVVENDSDWINFFAHKLTAKSTILHCPLSTITIDNIPIKVYKQLKKKINPLYDFYVIDGPRGRDRFSRYDICLLAENFSEKDDFIILFDDSQRKGEKETIASLKKILNRKKITYFQKDFLSIKSQTVIMTKKYTFIRTF